MALDESRGQPPASVGALTRRHILEVALGLFAERGYAGTSIRDITEQMGLTKASLYYHFASKEAILDAALLPLKGDMAELMALAAGRPAPSAEVILTALVDFLSRRGTLIHFLVGDPSIQRGPARPPEEFLEAITRALATGRSESALLRARAALGAAQFGAIATGKALTAALRTAPDRGADGTRAVHPVAAAVSGAHLLAARQRREIVEAALRALG